MGFFINIEFLAWVDSPFSVKYSEQEKILITSWVMTIFMYQFPENIH